MPISFDLFSYANRLEIKQNKSGPCLLDLTRKVYLKISPEEIVRQSLILRFKEEYHIPVSRMRTEYEIVQNNLKKRIDLLLFDKEGRPLMIVETKAPEVRLTQKTIDQVAFYNNVIFAPWLMIANGIEAMIAAIDFQSKDTREVYDFPLNDFI